MPYYTDKLLSAWPEDPIFEVGHLPPQIDPDILKTMTPARIGFRALNPRKTKANQIVKTRIVEANGSTTIAAPKFLSEKAREMQNSQENERRTSDVAETLENMALLGSTKPEVPVMYRNVEIKYSKFGVEDFDFKSAHRFRRRLT